MQMPADPRPDLRPQKRAVNDYAISRPRYLAIPHTRTLRAAEDATARSPADTARAFTALPSPVRAESETADLLGEIRGRPSCIDLREPKRPTKHPGRASYCNRDSTYLARTESSPAPPRPTAPTSTSHLCPPWSPRTPAPSLRGRNSPLPRRRRTCIRCTPLPPKSRGRNSRHDTPLPESRERNSDHDPYPTPHPPHVCLPPSTHPECNPTLTNAGQAHPGHHPHSSRHPPARSGAPKTSGPSPQVLLGPHPPPTLS